MLPVETSVSRIVKWAAGVIALGEVGMPEITPVERFSERPLGSLPEETDHW